MRALRTLRVAFAPAVVLALCGCPNTPVPEGNLGVPGAMAAVQIPDGGTVVFIAEGDGEDIKAVNINGGGTPTYVRGPNDINALSIPLSLTMNGTTYPTFRPTRLAGGDVGSSTGASLGFVLVAGAANRIAVVEAENFRITLSTTDAANCAGDPSAGIPPQTDISCLPQPALDVVASGGNGYALLQPSAAVPTAKADGGLADAGVGTQSVITMVASADPNLNVPVVDLFGGPFLLPTDPTGDGSHAVYSRIALSADGSTIYVARADKSQILAVSPGSGAVLGIMEPTQPELQDIGFKAIVVSPSYSLPVDGGTLTEASYILGILNDGTLATLNPALAMSPTVATPATPNDDTGTPLVALNLGAPSEDGVFMPCTPGDETCSTTVRTSTGSTTTTPAAAFFALDTGLVEALRPLDEYHPYIFQGINVSSVGLSIESIPSIVDPVNPATPASCTLSAFGATIGFTQNETITVTYHGELPGFESRSAIVTQITPADGGFPGLYTLVDTNFQFFDAGATVDAGTVDAGTPDAGTADAGPTDAGPIPVDAGSVVDASVPLVDATPFSATDCALLPANGGLANPCVDDLVTLVDIENSCPGVTINPGTIQAIDPATGTLTVSGALPCAGMKRAAYDILTARGGADAGTCSADQLAGNDCGPWVVIGTTSGYMGRAVTSPPDGGSIPFRFVGTDFYYGCGVPGCPVDAGTTAQDIEMTITGTDPVDNGSYFTFSTTSGYGPFEIDASAYSTTTATTTTLAGLAYGLAAVPDYLFISVVANDAVAEISVPNYTLANGSYVFQ